MIIGHAACLCRHFGANLRKIQGFLVRYPENRDLTLGSAQRQDTSGHAILNRMGKMSATIHDEGARPGSCEMR